MFQVYGLQCKGSYTCDSGAKELERPVRKHRQMAAAMQRTWRRKSAAAQGAGGGDSGRCEPCRIMLQEGLTSCGCPCAGGWRQQRREPGAAEHPSAAAHGAGVLHCAAAPVVPSALRVPARAGHCQRRRVSARLSYKVGVFLNLKALLWPVASLMFEGQILAGK